MKRIILLFLFIYSYNVGAQTPKPPYTSSKFEQLDELLPTPNTYRTGDGSPGPAYWQQKADYKIKVTLNDDNQTMEGTETITYYNNSPQNLNYIWLQLDQNRYSKESDSYKAETFSLQNRMSYQFVSWIFGIGSENGYELGNIRDAQGKALEFTLHKTMLRIDLPQPLKANGGTFTFSLDWKNKIRDADKMGSRGGYEYFEENNNYLYEIAQWFPRMAVYDDYNGWQNKQFLGSGEFALTFGDYEVEITVPEDHVVGATGVLQNPNEVLSSEQRQRLSKAEKSDSPVFIVSPEEALANEKEKASGTKTWKYKAENVRDFAFASSRKFIWDAQGVDMNGKTVMAMSLYPKEGNPTWGKYSTRVVAQTLETYSKYTFDYPYPVAYSVHGPIFGMEYPMICFNGGRPNPDGSNIERTRRAMISVIIHEVGHNYFPMIVNSDERQWTWMDEGLNSFLQYLTEQEIPKKAWAQADYPPSKAYPSRRGPAKNIVRYMRSDPRYLVPIMTNSEQIQQFGNNAYGKPATALNILRETVMGPELFDFAFKQYSQKWMFKHPKPADFFRTMEDASAFDLDWFWRGWFYTTEACDQAIDSVRLFQIPGSARSAESAAFTKINFEYPSAEELIKLIEQNGFQLSETEKNNLSADKFYYELSLSNPGGLVMPVIVQLTYVDGSKEMRRFPAEIWRKSPESIHKVILTDKEVISFDLDPKEELADIDTSNNAYPRSKDDKDSRFERFKNNQNE